MGWMESYIRVDNEWLDDEEFQKRTSKMRHLCFVGIKREFWRVRVYIMSNVLKQHSRFGLRLIAN